VRHQARNSEFSLTPDELHRLIQHAKNQRDRVMLQLFVYTGIRRAELQMLRKQDLDAQRRRLLVRHGKGGKQRILFLPDLLSVELREYALELRGSFLFPGRNGGPMSLRNINYIVGSAGGRAGISTPNPRYRNVGPHLLRHSFARNWKRAGGSLESLQKILGHSSLKTTLDTYGTESQDETEENYHAVVLHLATETAPFSHF